jgi:hypothetical protein
LRPNRRLSLRASVGLILVQELTFWRSASKVGALLRAVDGEQRRAKRNSLAGKLTAEARALADLKIERAAVESVRRVVEADLGPVKYLATLLGVANEVVLRWFILAVALLLDPAAVLLLLAATRTRDRIV